MRYKVFFTSGNTLIFEYGKVNIVNDAEGLARIENDEQPTINFVNVDYILPLDENANAESAVLKPLSPHELKTQQEKKRQALVSNPAALVAGIKQRAEGDD